MKKSQVTSLTPSLYMENGDSPPSQNEHGEGWGNRCDSTGRMVSNRHWINVKWILKLPGLYPRGEPIDSAANKKQGEQQTLAAASNSINNPAWLKLRDAQTDLTSCHRHKCYFSLTTHIQSVQYHSDMYLEIPRLNRSEKGATGTPLDPKGRIWLSLGTTLSTLCTHGIWFAQHKSSGGGHSFIPTTKGTEIT